MAKRKAKPRSNKPGMAEAESAFSDILDKGEAPPPMPMRGPAPVPDIPPEMRGPAPGGPIDVGADPLGLAALGGGAPPMPPAPGGMPPGAPPGGPPGMPPTAGGPPGAPPGALDPMMLKKLMDLLGLGGPQ